MHYTYILRSISNPDKTYVGYTSNLKARFKTHNSGQSISTAKNISWELEFYSAFDTKEKALAFEKYLKSGSGKAFTKKHF